MKSLLKIGLLAMLTTFLFQPSSGQNLLNKLKNKAQDKIEQRVEKRVEKKVDEKIEEELDKIEENIDKKKDAADKSDSYNNSEKEDRESRLNSRMQGIMKGLGVSGEPVTIADSYSFDNRIQMHLESYDKNGIKTSEGEFLTYFNSKTKNMAYQVVSGDMAKSGQGLFILDTENEATIILGDEKGKKTGIVYGMNSFMQSLGKDPVDEEPDLSETSEMYLANPHVTKTGNTKTIAGYKCEEYKYKDDDTESDIWVTENLKMNTQDFFGTIFRTSLYSHGIGWGYLMEANSLDKNTNERSIMKVTKVDTNSNVRFSMGDYQITNLGSVSIPADQ